MKAPVLCSIAAALAYTSCSFAAPPTPPSAQAAPNPPAASGSKPTRSTLTPGTDCSKVSGEARKKCHDKALGDVHSSPVMQSPEEKAAERARKQGKDPREAVKKIQEKDYPAKTPS